MAQSKASFVTESITALVLGYALLGQYLVRALVSTVRNLLVA